MVKGCDGAAGEVVEASLARDLNALDRRGQPADDRVTADGRRWYIWTVHTVCKKRRSPWTCHRLLLGLDPRNIFSISSLM